MLQTTGEPQAPKKKKKKKPSCNLLSVNKKCAELQDKVLLIVERKINEVRKVRRK